MAKKRAGKKTGKKKPLRKAGHSMQAKGPDGRKTPAGRGRRGRRAAKRAKVARKTGAASGLARKSAGKKRAPRRTREEQVLGAILRAGNMGE